MPLPAAPTPTHHFLERKRSIANARHKFALVAVRCRALPQQTCDLMKPCDAAMNWTFTVSDKQNTVPAFASTTATIHLAYRPLPMTRCRSTFPENTPLPILAFLNPAFVPIAAGSAAPIANWLSWSHAQLVIDKDDVHVAAPPLYLPMHQQDVICTILYCVCDISDNVHECTLCLEGYHGMLLHNTLCARCHNEVRSSFSLVRALTDTQIPTIHRTANITTTQQTTRWRGPESNGEIFEVGQQGQASEDCLG